MNKSADLKMTIVIGAGLTLGVLILIFSLTIGKSFFDMLFPDVSQLTIKSLDSLEEVVNKLENGENKTVLIYMSKGHYIISFDNKLEDPNFGSGKSGYYTRPSGCFQSSCLVICAATSSENSCNPPFGPIKRFNITSFEVDNPERGVITYTVGEYVKIYLEKSNDILIISELVNEN